MQEVKHWYVRVVCEQRDCARAKPTFETNLYSLWWE